VVLEVKHIDIYGKRKLACRKTCSRSTVAVVLTRANPGQGYRQPSCSIGKIRIGT
jgi:hypothetical protein